MLKWQLFPDNYTDCPAKCKARTITDFLQMAEVCWSYPCLSLPDAESHDPCVSLLDAGDDKLKARCTYDCDVS